MSYPFSLTGKVALVTGGSRGIGRAVVELLATLGADVVVNYVRDEQAALSVIKIAENKGVRSLAIQADVSQVKDATHLVQSTIDHFKHLDILICNAGIWEGDAVEAISEELWDRTLDLNLKGTWAVCRAAVPFMKAQQFGRIVMVSSTAGQRGEANFSNYAASKGGQISLTKSLSTELAPFGIHVNCVVTGWVVTEMSQQAFDNEEELQVILKTIPRGKVATAEEIAGPIAFLCTDWADHITGEVLNVNGGSVLCG